MAKVIGWTSVFLQTMRIAQTHVRLRAERIMSGEDGGPEDTKKDHGPRVMRAPMILDEFASACSGQ